MDTIIVWLQIDETNTKRLSEVTNPSETFYTQHIGGFVGFEAGREDIVGPTDNYPSCPFIQIDNDYFFRRIYLHRKGKLDG